MRGRRPLHTFFRSNPYWRPVLLVLVIFACLFPVLSNGWVSWDDDYYVLQNTNLQHFSWDGVVNLFRAENRVMDTYTPITLLGYALQYSLWGEQALGYHLVSLVLHLSCVMLVFYLMKQLTQRQNLALLIALLFGLHPMNMETVSWISGQKDLWCTAFVLSACLCYLRYLHVETQAHKSWAYVGCFLCFLLAVLAKPLALIFPLLLIGLDWVCARAFSWRLMLEKIPFVIGSVAIFWLALSLADPGISGFTAGEKMVLAAGAAGNYCFKMLLPIGLSCIHPEVRDAAAIPLSYYIALFTLIGVVGAALWWFRKARLALWGLLTFFLAIGIGLPLFKVHESLYYERFVYLGSIGFNLVVCYGTLVLLERYRPKWNRTFFAFGILITVIFGSASYQQTQVWKNDLTLFLNAAEKYPENYLPHARLALYYMEQRRPEKALAECNLTLLDNPSECGTLNNRGMLYILQKEPEKALQDFTAALQFEPHYAKARINRAALYLNTQRYQLAIQDLDFAASLEPGDYKVFYNRGLAHKALGKNQAALQDLQQAFNLASDALPVALDLAILESNLGRYQNALQHVNDVIRQQPDHARALFVRAQIQAYRSHFREAKEDALQARAFGYPVNEVFLNQLQQ